MQKISLAKPWPIRLRTTLWWAAIALAFWGVWRQYGGLGVLLGFSMLAFWVTIQFSQVMRVLRRAADRPKGTVAHALKMHVKLKQGMKLVDVIGMTGSLGEMLSPPNQQPEVFRWRDPKGDAVTVRFQDGRVLDHQIERVDAEAPAEAG